MNWMVRWSCVSAAVLLLASLVKAASVEAKMRDALRKVRSCKRAAALKPLNIGNSDTYDCMFAIDSDEDELKFETVPVAKVINMLIEEKHDWLSSKLIHKWIDTCRWKEGRTDAKAQKYIFGQLSALAREKDAPLCFVRLLEFGGEFVAGSAKYAQVLPKFMKHWTTPLPHVVIATLFRAEKAEDQQKMNEEVLKKLKADMGDRDFKERRKEIKTALAALPTPTYTTAIANAFNSSLAYVSPVAWWSYFSASGNESKPEPKTKQPKTKARSTDKLSKSDSDSSAESTEAESDTDSANSPQRVHFIVPKKNALNGKSQPAITRNPAKPLERHAGKATTVAADAQADNSAEPMLTENADVASPATPLDHAPNSAFIADSNLRQIVVLVAVAVGLSVAVVLVYALYRKAAPRPRLL